MNANQRQLKRRNKIKTVINYYSLKTLWRRKGFRWAVIIYLCLTLFFTGWGIWRAINLPPNKIFQEISYSEIINNASRGSIRYWDFKIVPDSEVVEEETIKFRAKILVSKRGESFSTKEMQFNFISYARFSELMQKGGIDNLVFSETAINPSFGRGSKNSVIGELADGKYLSVYIPPIILQDNDFFKALDEKRIAFWTIPSLELSESNFWGRWGVLILTSIPWISFPVFLLICNMIVRINIEAVAQKKEIKYEKSTVRFSDVAGIDEAKAEILKIVDFLRSPEPYLALGAQLPSGILLEGPPGCGKTLLAKAIAGECDLPFITSQEAGFVEIYVGAGPKRVRELFDKARRIAAAENTRVFVFIDEIDSIGKRRSDDQNFGGADEQNRTIAQLLQEMDGLQSDRRIIIFGATNRPEGIDRALLRPGRLSKRIVINPPSPQGRVGILKVHTKNKKLDSAVDLEKIARLTPTGTSGADLANICNEAAMKAGQLRKEAIDMKDFESAINEVLMGQERKSLILSDVAKWTFSSHEAGHALMALALKKLGYAVPFPKKISIIPTTKGMGGYTQFLEEEEKILLTKGECVALIQVLFGGRIAEQILTGEISSGAQNDYSRASSLSEQMAAALAMESEKLGQRVFTVEVGNQYLEKVFQLKALSPEKLNKIDEAIDERLNDCFEKAGAILRLNQEGLKFLAETIKKEEVVEFDQKLIDRINIKTISEFTKN